MARDTAQAVGFYQPQLDVLRFSAFALVFFCHAGPGDTETWRDLGLGPLGAQIGDGLVRAGGFGVDLFFALSAYLITTLLLREHAARGAVDLKSFYIRRALRIWPLYYAAILGFWLWQWVMPGEHFTAPYLAAFMAFAGNWACVFWGFPVSAVSPLWSVGFEEQFYLTWPLVLKWLEPSRLGWAAAAMIGLSLAVRLILCALPVREEALWCDSFARLDPIAMGILIALRPWRLSPARAAALAGACFAALMATGIVDVMATWRFTPVATYFTAAASGAGLVVAATQIPWRANGLTRALAYLGKISYGLYVFHMATIRVFDAFAPDDLEGFDLVRLVLPMAVTTALAALSYELFEKRFLILKQRFTHIPSRPA